MLAIIEALLVRLKDVSAWFLEISAWLLEGSVGTYRQGQHP